MLAQATCLALSAVLICSVVIWALLVQQSAAVDTTCVEVETGSRAPFFVAMFLAGALLNCKEFLAIPLLSACLGRRRSGQEACMYEEVAVAPRADTTP
eukprot:CAMPEP_0177254452 /NCGR_PEP_ID=MMETSP0367-20130122/55782_1 /TAXON_ID=447022 ORGANISM="Scrippsiella hangoei-like, Strain SHHI-4" /NCGR_SAMPLE_ID=MMETSP0367 /ASSEMBLY_ACC=CAM_ASM_000362 /LENGTH=97 /DNA_ID=CAMNT_0018708003 /DNA_START=1 /DNA_END=291 /DNA_ORIENTATION=+